VDPFELRPLGLFALRRLGQHFHIRKVLSSTICPGFACLAAAISYTIRAAFTLAS
jgi:hypothetical protein